MIDTIKIAVYREFNASIYDALLYHSENRQSGFIINSVTGIAERQDLFRYKFNQYDQYEQMIIKGKIHISSFNYNIHYRVQEDRIELEFSLPKFIYGSNVLELRAHYNRFVMNPYNMLVLSVKRFFDIYFFGHKVDYGAISLLRWDLCYNQVYETREQSLKALEYIKLKNNKKSDVKNYEYGIIQLTKTNYLKIYHKGEEYKKHDQAKVKIYNSNFELMAERILRYEKKITPKNVAYYYNTKFKYQNQPLLVREYLKAKVKGKVSPQMRKDFECVQNFTLGNSKMKNHVKLDDFLFNHLYSLFREDIRKKFSIGRVSVDRLKHEVINENEKVNRTIKIRILSLIKVFGSLQKAREKKAISDATFYRYRNYMENRNLSEVNIKADIYQCWNSDRYYQAISGHGINVNFLTKDLNF